MSSLKGWVRLEHLRPGAIFKTRDGVLAIKTEYRYTNNNPQPMCILLASGEYAHFAALEMERVMEIKLPEMSLDCSAAFDMKAE